ncbi:aminoglycoside 6-adenylyltransferase [Sedimentibacter acidaminivorans]|uniref:Aminoglycoside 6-adenylyltransferase n=1 Tax=Sedimentibacter acidaminivorans TaxID=913099 RepID=A0ABS4GAG4_9FIRM|nr:aminoglycoside 6-adenylyltransferase [Sedimentibacter acidaminivorans]MBP1924676.1 aminoglycoside 6-adenylyltransferase [Sedimentibacter acidaminivorans]
MRNESEMLDTIINVANVDENIKAVVLCGSRANNTVKKDIYQDYDIIFIVNETDKYVDSDYFRKCFGERVLLFRPDKIYPELFENTCAYLMLFDDENRIDLRICTTEKFMRIYEVEELGQPMIKLIDKNNFLPEIAGKINDVFTIKIPNEKAYNDTCAEFFWELQNIGKGIMRDEISYVMFLLNVSVRDMLNRMIDWYIGVHNDFSVTTGKLGKYYKEYLDERLYNMYKKTYPRAEYYEVWEVLMIMIKLFKETAICVANEFEFIFPEESEIVILEHLEYLKGTCN